MENFFRKRVVIQLKRVAVQRDLSVSVRYGIHGPKWLTDDPCFYCGRPSETWDHIVPKSLGGKGIDNLVRACANCNGDKSNMSLLQFLLYRQKTGYYRKMYPISRYERKQKRMERKAARALDNASREITIQV